MAIHNVKTYIYIKGILNLGLVLSLLLSFINVAPIWAVDYCESDSPFETIVYEPIIGSDKFTIVLDAGHGGHDSGNRGNGYIEKDIALNIVLQVGTLLEKDPKFNVIYTRKDDSFVELFERGAIANRASADLFVSVHCNAHSSQAYGTETFVLGLHKNDTNFEVAKKENAAIMLEDDYESNYEGFDPNSAESVIGLTLMQEEYLEQSLNLASLVQKNFTNKLKKNNRGVKQAGFIVLHKTFMPSILIETGFLSNTKEGKYLNSSKGQNEMAISIYDAIKKYKQQRDILFESIANEIEQEAVAHKAVVKPDVETSTSVAENVDEAIESLKEASSASTKSGVLKSEKSLDRKSKVATNTANLGIAFKIQIAASSSDLPLEPDNFKGLNHISKAQVDNLYKYYYKQASSLEEVQNHKEEAKNAGFPSCFVVAFKDGQRIALAEALKLVD